MTGARTPAAGGALHHDPVLAHIWLDAGHGALHAVAAGSDGTAGAVIVVTDEPVELAAAELRILAERMAAALGLESVKLVTVQGPSPRTVIRDWLFQAAGGSGRGIAVEPVEIRAGRWELRVSSPDSSAREVELRLAAAGGESAPEALALAALLGCRAVLVRESRQR